MKVTKYIVEHYKDYVEPMGYKAFIVAVDKEVCALYKQEFHNIFGKSGVKVKKAVELISKLTKILKEAEK